MTAIPLARFLVDFGSGEDTGVGGKTLPGRRAGDSATGAGGGARIAEALARSHEEGRAAAEAELQGKLDAQRHEFEQRLMSERRAWVEQEAGVLAARVSAAMRDMEVSIADSAARILKPFLATELQRHVVEDLAAAVRGLVSSDASARMVVSGPEDLVGALREKLEGVAANLTFSIKDSPDMQVVLDQTIVESRLAAWLARMQEAMA